jgi:hypothetical protein
MAALARLDGDGRVLDAAQAGDGGVDDLGLPAVPLGEPLVHPQQIAREEGGLVPALARLDLEDRVALVVRVLGHQQYPQPVLEGRLGHREVVRLPGEGRVLPRQLERGLLVLADLLPLAVGVDDRRQLRVPLGERPGLIRVRVHVRIGEGTLQLGMLTRQLTQPVEQGENLLSRAGQALP